MRAGWEQGPATQTFRCIGPLKLLAWNLADPGHGWAVDIDDDGEGYRLTGAYPDEETTLELAQHAAEKWCHENLLSPLLKSLFLQSKHGDSNDCDKLGCVDHRSLSANIVRTALARQEGLEEFIGKLGYAVTSYQGCAEDDEHQHPVVKKSRRVKPKRGTP